MGMDIPTYLSTYSNIDRAKMAAEDLASRPGRLMDDLSKLGSSVSQGLSDLTSGISDIFTGGRDDTPSADPSIPDYLRMNQPIIGGGVIPDQAPSFGLSPGAMGGRSPLDLTGFEQRFATSDMGTIPDELQFPAMDSGS